MVIVEVIETMATVALLYVLGKPPWYKLSGVMQLGHKEQRLCFRF